MGIVSNGSFWVYDVEELRSQDPNWPTHEGWGEFQGDVTPLNYIRWTVPEGVHSISVLLIGGGGLGNLLYQTQGAMVGGGGGQLVYMNDIPVTPGDTYTISGATPRNPADDSSLRFADFFGVMPMLAEGTTFGDASNAMLVAFPGVSGSYLQSSSVANTWGPYAGSGGGYTTNGAKANLTTVFNVSQTAIDNVDGGGRGGNGNTGGAGGAGGYSGAGGDASSSIAGNPGSGTGGGGSACSVGTTYFNLFGGGVYPYGQTSTTTSAPAAIGPNGAGDIRNYRKAKYSLWNTEAGGPKPTTQSVVSVTAGGQTYYANGVHRFGFAGSHPGFDRPWPQYNTFYPGDPYVGDLQMWNIKLEHGLIGAGQAVKSYFTEGGSGTTYDYNFSLQLKSGFFRIVWPGNVRKFPAQNVQYVPNPGSTWGWESDTPNNRRTDRDGFLFSIYTQDGYQAP